MLRALVDTAVRRASVGAACVSKYPQWEDNCRSSTYVWTEEDYQALRRAAADLNARPEDLLLVLEYESGRNPHRAFCNCEGYPKAAGLNQITGVSSDAMGLTENERLALLEMNAAEQMPFVVKSFLAARNHKPFPSPPDAVTLYQTNIAPGTVGREVIFTKKTVGPCPPPNQSKGDAYCANAGLDRDGDGAITRADLAIVLSKTANTEHFKRAIKELHGEMPVISGATTSDSGSGLGLGTMLLGGLLAAGGYYYWKHGRLPGLPGGSP